jgi:hypothetical protein
MSWGVFIDQDECHVIPIEDIPEHAISRDCACKPNLTELPVIIHHSWDCRELIEEAEAIKKSVL